MLELGLVVCVAIVAFGIGRAYANGHARLAIATCILPLAIWLLTKPTLLLALLGASLPLLQNVAGGSLGYQVSVSDLLLVLLTGGILFQWATSDSAPEIRALRLVKTPVVAYCTIMILLIPLHLGLGNGIKTGQRFELFLIPLVVGAFAGLSGRHLPLLKAYVLSTAVLAATFPVHDFGLQKNPVGQLIANAILLLIGFRALHRFLPLLVVLVPGLVLTQSRGAILAAAIGVTVIVLMRGLSVRQLAIRLVPLVLAAGLTFVLLPGSARQHITTVSASQSTSASYSIWYRDQYAKDAKRIIDAHQWSGVGIGNYGIANAASTNPVEDPHDVLLLQAAEGGYLLAAGFVVIIAGCALALIRVRRIDLAPAAAGVLLATVAHGLVDVYWVRGTPVLSWVLVGAVCGLFASKTERAELA